jgi:hypothetical protein
MEKPNWARSLEDKILKISKSVSTSDQFYANLIEYCNNDNIAISTPEKLQEEGHLVFLAQKTDEVGIPSSLQVLKMEEEMFSHTS